MSRKLDIAVAEALGYKVDWRCKVWRNKEYICIPCKSFEPCAQPFFDGYKQEKIVPKYSTDGNAMLELDAEMRKRNWRLDLWFADAEDIYVALYEQPNSDFTAEGKSETIPEAVAFAAYNALIGRERNK